MYEAEKVEIYIHIPFCERKCAYCDFLSFHASAAEQKEYVEALKEEMRQTWCDLPVSTVFIGGGTPSAISYGYIEEILGTLRECYDVMPGAEITLEANPGTVSAEKLSAYRGAGVNRLSFGCQSFHDDELAVLSRIHTKDDILKSFHMARESGFDNINLDLMYALPGQSIASWKDTLKQALALGPEHISAYSLMIEDGTPFSERYGGPGGDMLPDEDAERAMAHLAADMTSEHGFRQYEISNYAREGYESRHNTGYWTGVPYIGLGLGASSYLPETLAADSMEESEEEIWRAGMSFEAEPFALPEQPRHRR